MADPTGIQGALALDAVEWASGDGDKLTIRVRGRWRRRRPEWRGQPVLVVEAHGTRHRFPAIPEPPSLAGAPPGGWEMTFSVPASLAPHLGVRMWLQLGLAVVPLPSPTAPPPGAEPETASVADPETLAERRARTAELAAQRARERQAEAEALVADITIQMQRLEQQLEHALREPKRLRRLLEDRDRRRRAAEQRAHAERALRLELQDALDGDGLPAMPPHLIEAGELAEAEARIRELEEQLRALRRRAEDAGARPEPMPVARVAATPAELAAVVAELRSEFEQLTAAAESEHLERVAAQERAAALERALAERDARSTPVSEAVYELRGLLDQLRREGGSPAGSEAQAPVEPERFDAALSRLRASTPTEPDLPGAPLTDEPSPPVKPWLSGAFARLLARDPDAAGRLVVGLLPAQGAVHAGAVAYDLVLGDAVVIQVTLGDPPATPAIVVYERPRERGAVAFRVTGDHAALARLVESAAARRLFRRGRARVEGSRGEVVALFELVRAPLGLDELFDAGVRLEPRLALLLAAAMIEPSWTAEERFTIAHLDGAPTGRATYLHVRRGELPTVSDAPPPQAVATTIVCPAETLLAVLAGKLDAAATITGDAAPLLGLIGWLERAQRG